MGTEVACGWTGAVMKKTNVSIWAGTVMQKTPKNAKKAKGDGPIDQPNDRPTDQHSGLATWCSTGLTKK